MEIIEVAVNSILEMHLEQIVNCTKIYVEKSDDKIKDHEQLLLQTSSEQVKGNNIVRIKMKAEDISRDNFSKHYCICICAKTY